MSRQLALSAAFSVFMMSAYVLFGGDAARAPLRFDSPTFATPVEVAAPAFPGADKLLPSMR